MNFNTSFQGGAKPLSDGIVRHIDNVVGTLYQQRRIDQMTAQNLAGVLKNNINNIEGDLRRTISAYNRPIQDADIENMVVNYASTIMNRTQQPQFGNQQPQQFGNQQFGNNQLMLNQSFGSAAFQNPPQSSFTTSYLDKPGETQVNAQTQQPQTTNQIQPSVDIKTDVNGRIILAKTGNPHINYDFINDGSYLDYSTTSKESGPIIDVTSKAEIRGGSSIINFSSVDCRVIEPSVGRVIDNFIDTNPKLLVDNFVVDISYRTFVLKRMKYIKNDIVDISALDQGLNLPSNEIVSSVIANIESLAKSKADTIQELIVREFNDQSERYIRLDERMKTTLIVEDFKDIMTLVNPGNEYQDFANCGMYHEVIRRAFRESVKKIIFKETQMGCFDTHAIAPDLLASPRFIIRGNGLYERESDFTSADMINAVNAKYTAFGLLGNIVITNFIPHDLEEDFNQASSIRIQPDRITNPFEYLIFNVWKNKPKTILVYRSGKPYMVIKNGMTLSGQHFIFQSNINLNYGL